MLFSTSYVKYFFIPAIKFVIKEIHAFLLVTKKNSIADFFFRFFRTFEQFNLRKFEPRLMALLSF